MKKTGQELEFHSLKGNSSSAATDSLWVYLYIYQHTNTPVSFSNRMSRFVYFDMENHPIWPNPLGRNYANEIPQFPSKLSRPANQRKNTLLITEHLVIHLEGNIQQLSATSGSSQMRSYLSRQTRKHGCRAAKSATTPRSGPNNLNSSGNPIGRRLGSARGSNCL